MGLLGKREAGSIRLSRHCEACALQFVLQARGTIRLVIAQHGVADASEFVGERADGFVVVSALLDLQCPAPQRIDGALHSARDVSGVEH